LFGAAAAGVARAELAGIGGAGLGELESAGLVGIGEAGFESGVGENEVDETVPETF